MVEGKHAFWQALVFTVIIFAIGILLGFFLEGSRSDTIQLNLLSSEINLLDEQVRTNNFEQFEIDCSLFKQSTLEFADKIYNEVRQLEQYDSRAKLDDSLKILHKRYDLLRMMLWMEGIELRKNCGKEFHTVVYIFDYAPEGIELKARQASISRLLLDLKEQNGEDVLLIPIAGNLNLASVELILKKYGVSELPVIIVDEDKVIYDIPTLPELENIVFEKKGYSELEGVLFREVDSSGNERIVLNP